MHKRIIFHTVHLLYNTLSPLGPTVNKPLNAPRKKKLFLADWQGSHKLIPLFLGHWHIDGLLKVSLSEPMW